MDRIGLTIMSFAMVCACCGGGTSGGVDGSGVGPNADARPGNHDAGEPPATTSGCGDTTLLEVPTHTAQRGPWPVGVRTVSVGALTVEVWYPAKFGSDAGKTPVRYDIRPQLPASQQGMISDSDNPWQDCDCYRDLELDTSHGPYPVVVFVHGTAAFRTQSLAQMTHWASRGFVVVAADHPGLKLADMLSFVCPDSASGSQNLDADVDAMLGALESPSGELDFLADRIDMTRIGVVGHSAGGNAAGAASAKDGVRIVIPMAAGPTTDASGALETSLFLGADADAVVSYSSVKSGYESSPSPKRFIGIGNTGHLAFSQLCELTNTAGKNLVEVADAAGVCGVFLAGALYDCKDEYIAGPLASEIVNYATSAALESVLHCSGAAANFDALQSNYPEVVDHSDSL